MKINVEVLPMLN